MNKRILSILLCFMLVMSLLVMAVPVSAAADAAVTITADKTTAKPGDTVTFTLTLGPIDALGSAGFNVAIPEGLTYGTATTAEGLAAKMGMLTADLNDTDGTCRFTCMALDNATLTEDTVLGTFTATVDDDATGVLTVDVADDDFLLFTDADDNELGFTKAAATVEIGEPAPVDPTAAPVDPTVAPVDPTVAPVDPTEAPATPDDPATPDEPTHEHKLVFVAQVDATPDANGVAAHYECTECGKKFADASATIEVTDEDLVLIYQDVAPGDQATGDQATGDQATGDQKATGDQSTKDSAGSDATPKTGDATHTVMWLVIMLGSMAGAAGVLYTAKRKGIFTK